MARKVCPIITVRSLMIINTEQHQSSPNVPNHAISHAPTVNEHTRSCRKPLTAHATIDF